MMPAVGAPHGCRPLFHRTMVLTMRPLPRTSISLACALTCGLALALASGLAAAQAAKPGTATTTSSGLVYQLVKPGSGAQPAASDVVKVHYRGTLTDGTEFDSSYKRGEPAQFPLNRVIPCWTEGLQMMKVGGTARLTCPPTIAYGARGAGNVIPPNATLRFEVELLGIQNR
jgi:FKBP-type peptidyl-prolyl cis-trans isomerase FkpA